MEHLRPLGVDEFDMFDQGFNLKQIRDLSKLKNNSRVRDNGSHDSRMQLYRERFEHSLRRHPGLDSLLSHLTYMLDDKIEKLSKNTRK